MAKIKLCPLTLASYQKRACESNQFRGKDTAIDQLRFGLFGEIGTTLSLVKKSHRDLHDADLECINEELGDALWYLTTAATEYGSNLNDVGQETLSRLQAYFSITRDTQTKELTFKEFDGLVEYSKGKLNSADKLIELRQLGINCCQLLMDSNNRDLAVGTPLTALSTILFSIIIVGALFDQSFTSIAERNLDKIESRWPPKGSTYISLFDEGRSSLEKFPRQFSMHFIELLYETGKPYVIQQLNGVNIGDRLTDNRTQPDGYRFHDVFHLSYLVHLGWSPVIRALLKLKRKTDPNIDENEDGARAIIIEEGIATWIFNHADSRDYFEDVQVGRLDYNILKQVANMVKGYEVEACPMWQWEKAILDGFRIFRSLRDGNGGVVQVDMLKRTLEYMPLPNGATG